MALTNLAAYLESSAGRWPDRPAVVDPEGWSLSYAQLDDQANRVAAFLSMSGVLPGDRVGLCLPKGARTIAAIFGVLKARAVYVPVDYTAPAERNRAIFNDCDVRVVFGDPSCANDLLELCPPGAGRTLVVVGTSELTGVSTWDDVLTCMPEDRRDGRHQDDVAYVLYTSGSTGIPKGVVLTHENALSFVEWCAETFDLSETDRCSSHAPFHFDLSVFDIYASIRHGSCIYIISESLGKSPRELAAFIAEHRLTVWYSTPSILSLLAEHGGLDRLDCTSIRMVLFAGEVFPIKHLRKLVSIWPWPAYYNLYGPTETNVCTFAHIPTPIPVDRTEPYPIGDACSHCAALVLDENDQPVAPGDEGMLYIAGPSVFRGYWNRPVENEQAFLERDGVRWYCTGDVVQLDSQVGYVYLGRRDRMVKRRGYRIELDEIQTGLYRHTRLREVAVVSQPDPDSGVKIYACVVPTERPAPSIVELKQFCARELPSYMSPDVFRVMDVLPRTSTDKVDYPALRRAVQEGVSGSDRPAAR